MLANRENNNEKTFESELYNSLKFYGYLFPENVLQVERFDKLFDVINSGAPGLENLFPLNNQFSNPESFDLNLSIAAYSDENSQFPEFPEKEPDAPETENKQEH
ncbi:MAG TPA: hypothetical protein VGM63_00250 [Mucilaginibacter sp.]|jgi:hypothetical protein